MSRESDPFGFEGPQPGYSPRPITVVALQPGQEVRIVVAGTAGGTPVFFMDSSSSPRGSGDSSASPKGQGDSSASPRGQGDDSARDPFGFGSGPQPAYSPRPITIVAQAGQEVRVVAPDEGGGIPGLIMSDSRSSPKGSGDGIR